MADVESLQCKCNFGVVKMPTRIPWDFGYVSKSGSKTSKNDRYKL